MKNVISNLAKIFYVGELPRNYFLLYTKLPNMSKFKQKNLDKIYFARDNEIKFTCFRILSNLLLVRFRTIKELILHKLTFSFTPYVGKHLFQM